MKFGILAGLIGLAVLVSAWPSASQQSELDKGITELLSVVPDSGAQGENLWVSVTGTNTHFEQGSSTQTVVWFSQGSSTLNSGLVYVHSETYLEAYFALPTSMPLGPWDVLVNTTDYPTETMYDGFTVFAPPQIPEIVWVDPNSGYQGEDLFVNIVGENTHFSQASSTTTMWLSTELSTIYANYVNVFSPTHLEASLSIPETAELGAWDVSVSDDIDGTVSLEDGFSVDPAPVPAITAVNPSLACQGAGLWVSVFGQNTNFGEGSSPTSAWFSRDGSIIPAEAVNVGSATTLTMKIGIPQYAEPGPWDVSVYNDIDDTVTAAGLFTVLHCYQVKDTVRIGCPVIMAPLSEGDSVGIPILIYNEEFMGGFSLGFQYNSDYVEVTSIDYAGSFLGPAQLGFALASFRPEDNQILIGWADFTGGLPIAPTASDHAELYCHLNLRALPGATPQTIDLDSTFVIPGGAFILTVDTNSTSQGGLISITPHYVDCGLEDIFLAEWICGDADGNGAIDIADVVFLVSYIFASGPAPDPLYTADVDLNGIVNITDAVLLIHYIILGGPEPCSR